MLDNGKRGKRTGLAWLASHPDDGSGDKRTHPATAAEPGSPDRLAPSKTGLPTPELSADSLPYPHTLYVGAGGVN